MQYVRGNYWAGETFTNVDDAQHAAQRWCAQTAGTRIHGTTCARPLEVFTAEEQPKLLARPTAQCASALRALRTCSAGALGVFAQLLRQCAPHPWIGVVGEFVAEFDEPLIGTRLGLRRRDQTKDWLLQADSCGGWSPIRMEGRHRRAAF